MGFMVLSLNNIKLTDVVPSAFLTVLQRTILSSNRILFFVPDSSVTKESSSTYVFRSKGLGSIPIMFDTLITFIFKNNKPSVTNHYMSSCENTKYNDKVIKTATTAMQAAQACKQSHAAHPMGPRRLALKTPTLLWLFC
jgi:hypothetical protein